MGNSISAKEEGQQPGAAAQVGRQCLHECRESRVPNAYSILPVVELSSILTKLTDTDGK